MSLLPILRRRTSAFSPWRDWELLEDRVQRLMGGISLGEPAAESFVLAPRVDFAEENQQYMLTAELPGVDPSDVHVEVEGNVVSIRGEKKVEREKSDERIQLAERRYGSFERSFTLPSAANPEKISAAFHQGILRVEIDKRPEATGRKIEVQ